MQFVESESNISRRNLQALKIFTKNGFFVRHIGDEHSPMFIFEDRILLSCFVNGNNLYFRSSPDTSNVIRTVQLFSDVFITKYEIEEIIEKSIHLPVFRIEHTASKMCLVGFNRFDTDEEEHSERFPVFANYNPIVYVNLEKAESVADELTEKGYNIQLI